MLKQRLSEDLSKFACAFRERVNRKPVLLKNGHVQIAHGAFCLVREIATMAEAQVGTSGKNGRIVAGVVSCTGRAAEQSHRIVQQPRISLAD